MYRSLWWNLRGPGAPHHLCFVTRTAPFSSKRWLKRHVSDPYAQRAVKEGTRSRAYYKFEEVEKRFGLMNKVKRGQESMQVVDLGSAPGGWSLAVSKLALGGEGLLVSVDLLPMEPVGSTSGNFQTHFIQGDFMKSSTRDRITELVGGTKSVDLVVSDILHNTTGNKARDHDLSMNVVQDVIDFAVDHLKPGGSMVAKMLNGETSKDYVQEAAKLFKVARLFKPKASRPESAEIFLVATDFAKK